MTIEKSPSEPLGIITTQLPGEAGVLRVSSLCNIAEIFAVFKSVPDCWCATEDSSLPRYEGRANQVPGCNHTAERRRHRKQKVVRANHQEQNEALADHPEEPKHSFWHKKTF